MILDLLTPSGINSKIIAALFHCQSCRPRRISIDARRHPPAEPGAHDAIDVLANELAGIGPRHPVHHEVVVASVLVSDRSYHSQLHGFGIKGAASAGAADPPAATSTGVPGDALRPIRRAPWKLRANRSREIRHKVLVLDSAPFGLALAAPFPRRTVDQAFLLGL